MTLVDYVLPDFWASALINGDESGMDDDDVRRLNWWLSETFPKGAHCVSVSEDEGDFMRWHDARDVGVLSCNCLTYTFDITE